MYLSPFPILIPFSNSAFARDSADESMQKILSPWPVRRPANWIELLNTPQKETELAALHCAKDRGRPYGEPQWAAKTAAKLGVESSLKPIGRPKKKKTF